MRLLNPTSVVSGVRTGDVSFGDIRLRPALVLCMHCEFGGSEKRNGHREAILGNGLLAARVCRHGMFVVSIAYRNAVAAAVVAPIRSCLTKTSTTRAPSTPPASFLLCTLQHTACSQVTFVSAIVLSHRRLELREEEEGREEGMRTRDETVILRAAAVLLCSVGLLAAWMPTAAALWLSMPTSATKCVSEEIHAGVVAMADYAVINDDDPRNAPTISVKVPEKLTTLMHNCGFLFEICT
ncbi:hypothetical protein GW17_00007235 [Ensete ventricosum]|nr:hypothetical protein GW17_00007235 [Ensete ventricosum]